MRNLSEIAKTSDMIKEKLKFQRRIIAGLEEGDVATAEAVADAYEEATTLGIEIATYYKTKLEEEVATNVRLMTRLSSLMKGVN